MPKNPSIINLVGAPGAGKSFAARRLAEELGYTHLSYASALRREVGDFLGLNYLADCDYAWLKACAPELITEFLKCQGDINQNNRIEQIQKKSLPYRKLLQLWGTELRRAQNSEYWVDQLRATIESVCDKQDDRENCKFVIDDSRFPNEFAWNSGPILYIYNEEAEREAKYSGVNDHSSENLRQIIWALSILERNPTFMGRRIFCIANYRDEKFAPNILNTVDYIQSLYHYKD